MHVDTGPDLALLTDGLRAEREQGVTIDVRYERPVGSEVVLDVAELGIEAGVARLLEAMGKRGWVNEAGLLA